MLLLTALTLDCQRARWQTRGHGPPSAPPVEVERNTGGWAFKDDGSLKNVSSYGTNEFTLASSETDPLHGGQVLYVFSGGYQCEDPVKFSIGTTL